MELRGLATPSAEPQRVFDHFRVVFGARRPRATTAGDGEAKPFTPGRDPLSLGRAMSTLSTTMGWSTPLAEASLAMDWPLIVGDTISAHTEVIAVTEGTLIIQCDSSAWATQLRMMRNEVLQRLADQVPEADINKIDVKGPGSPSWKKGPRSVPGRGPRDTYG